MNTNDPWLQKVPPHNIEAEQSILSAILIENNTLPEVLEILSDQDFYREAHRKIFKAMVELFEKNEPADLAELVDAVPMAVNAAHYAKIIQEKASLRRLIEQAASITTRCFEDKGDVEEILDFAERSIFDISENKIKPSFYTLGEILTDTYKAVEEPTRTRCLSLGSPRDFKGLMEKPPGFSPGISLSLRVAQAWARRPLP
jgi:replicative DNA helicase